MNQRFLFTFLTCALLLASCNGTADAPAPSADIQAWVESPHEGATLPMGVVPLIVYASASEGISFIQIRVNGQALPAIPAQSLAADGSARLVRVDYSFTPPGQGEYRVEAAGVNASGASGGYGSTRFCIVTCDAAAPPTITPAPAETETPTPAAGLDPTVTPTAPGIFSVQFYADPATINAGSCSTIRWDVTAAETVSVYYFGDVVGLVGSHQTCPCAEEIHTLRVVKTDGTSQDYYATVYVSGSCSLPPPPTAIPPTTAPPPPSDTTGPSINSTSVYWDGCSIYGVADAADPSGMNFVEFWYNFNNTGWQIIAMNQSGSEWTSQLGVDTLGAPGSVKYKFHAVDSLGNHSWTNVFTKDFAGCGY